MNRLDVLDLSLRCQKNLVLHLCQPFHGITPMHMLWKICLSFASCALKL